jgi:hypothetical protein
MNLCNAILEMLSITNLNVRGKRASRIDENITKKKVRKNNFLWGRK